MSRAPAIPGKDLTDLMLPRLAGKSPAAWETSYRRQLAATDTLCALAVGALALKLGFNGEGGPPTGYLALSLSLPPIWLVSLALVGGYDARFIGVGAEEFRRVLNAGVGLTAAVAVLSYAAHADIARGYVVIALPGLTLVCLIARYVKRKWLHRFRRNGGCMRRVIAVGHRLAIADLATELRRETYHGMSVVAACTADQSSSNGELAGIPEINGLGNVVDAVQRFGADTVAIVPCPEISGIRLRELLWELEKTSTDLYVAPALLDVAGPRTTIRPVAGLPLLHLDHPEITRAKQFAKGAFDRALALTVLMAAAPLFIVIALAIRLGDHGPVLFRQTRVGKNSRVFTMYKFRTMTVDAEERKASLAAQNEKDGALFKIRHDPRITRTGCWLRRWSLDELPQLINVICGDMAMVGPRPALPDEAARYRDYARHRLVVKPGITGLWQVNGRSELSWEDAVRLDLRYVDSWSFALDLQILWKTCGAVLRGSGAY